ncbi:MAG: VWA domain-containing protein [Burkholderiales bacterium]|nr:VWA domain-containing protein [Opitutaceae bacterium]
MQPFLRREASRAQRLPVLIDISASMAALDAPGGTTRLDAAKKRVRELIDTLPPDQDLALIAFGQSARRLTGFTNNRRELRLALDSLAVEDVTGDLDEALRMAQALTRSAAFDKVLLLSDGNFPARTNFELPFKIDFQRLADAGPNYGITAFNARRAPGGKWDVFVQLAASTEAETASGTVELEQDGTVVGTESVTIPKGATPRLVFQVASDQPAQLRARLTTTGFDSLAADNTASLDLPAARPLAVFCPPKLTAYRHALASLDALTLFPDETLAPPAAFDLVITDDADDLAYPARTRCLIGLVPEELKALVTVKSENTTAIDWRRESPLLQHVQLGDVVFMDQPVSAATAKDDAFANLGYEILAQGPRGPLIVERTDGDALLIALLFHTDRSTLPYRVGFPIFVSNVVQAALKQSGLAEAAAARTGVLPPLTLAPNRAVHITGPDRFARDERTDDRGQLTGIPAPRAGDYTITDGTAAPRHIGASLLSPAETSLAAVTQIEFADQLTVAATTAVPKADRSLWWLLACTGFVVLLVEWWWFQRRPGAA